METLKFNEYNALSNHLQKEGSSINEFVKEITGEFLNEDNQTLDVEKPKLLWIKSPAAAWAMRGLTKAAKQAQKIIQTKLLAKHYPKVLENQRKMLQQAKALLKKGHTNEEVTQILKGNIATMQNYQTKQLKTINDSIDSIIANFSKKITSFINKKNLSDRRKLTVENYWILLTTQLHQIAYNSMINKEEEFLHDIIQENEDLVTFKDKITSKNVFDTFIEKDKKKEAEAKAKIKEDKEGDDEEETAEEETAEEPAAEEPAAEEPAAEEPAAEEPAAEEPAAEELAEKPAFKKGQIWMYIGKDKEGKNKTKYGKITVIGPGKTAKGTEIADGSIQFERVELVGSKWKKKTLEGKGSLYTSSADVLKRRGSKLKKEATPEDTFDSTKYKKGTKWNYKNSKGITGIVEIIGPKDGGIEVKQVGGKGTIWIVRRDGLLQDKVKE